MKSWTDYKNFACVIKREGILIDIFCWRIYQAIVVVFFLFCFFIIVFFFICVLRVCLFVHLLSRIIL